LVSCRKDKNEPDIKQYDQQQIQNYISTNHITGMVRDTVGGDTTGLYYKIILPGSGTPLAYTDNVSFVFQLRSFDGTYQSLDTVDNHYQGYVGHVVSNALPNGLQLAIINDLKYSGGSMRILIPSHLAYGLSGYGSGSSQNANSHILGNQCLDYYVHIIAKQPDVVNAQNIYDYQVIQNYLAADGLSSLYTLDSGVYYHIQTQGTGTDPITNNSTVEVSYNGRLVNGTEFDESYIGVDTTSVEIPNLVQGVQRVLRNHAVKGSVVSMFMPSSLGYGQTSITGVPANSCLRFEFTVVDVSP